MKDYCETFHLIDKGNGAKAHYDMWGKSRTHNWSPKLVFRLWNMSMHNAYKIYSALHKQYTPDQKHLSMKQWVKELTFDLLQRGGSMRERKAEHPGYTVDLSQILGWTAGRKTRSDAKWMPPPTETTTQVQELSKKVPWLIHTPVFSDKRGRCCWEGCPGLIASAGAKRQCCYDLYIHCEQCSAEQGTAVYLCLSTHGKKRVDCHRPYHAHHCMK